MGDGPQPGGRSRPVAWVLAGLLGAFLVARFVIWSRGVVFVTNDAGSYVWHGGRGFDRGPLLSLTGHAPRLWGTPLLYALLPGDPARVFAQWALGTLAWGLLAWVVAARLRTGPGKIVGAAGILLLALMPQVAAWDFTILSEPLSITLGVSTLALLLQWLATGSRAALVGLTATAFWLVFVRPELWLVVAVVALVLVVRAWRDRAHRRPPALAYGALLVAITWVNLITPTMSQTYADRSFGLTLEEATFNYRLRMQVLPNPEIATVYREQLGMPRCTALEETAKLGGWRMTRIISAYLTCPELVAWGKENARSSGWRFARAAPGLYARETMRTLPLALGGATYGRSGVLLPPAVTGAAFPAEPARVLPRLFGGLALALAAAVATGAWRRRRLLVATGAVLALVSIAAILAELLFAAGEYGRFGIQEAIWFRVAVWLIAAAALDTALERLRRRRRAGPAAPESTPAAG
ncbi:hypothetical protein [Catellatospora vulcania]|uniref:hypothetical protein n=1 Tax=Catellatospora vulcania TaxID=1460450 RepID=UPI0012D474E4|nr:hypothetical protein [Catellatospora vulcania]